MIGFTILVIVLPILSLKTSMNLKKRTNIFIIALAIAYRVICIVYIYSSKLETILYRLYTHFVAVSSVTLLIIFPPTFCPLYRRVVKQYCCQRCWFSLSCLWLLVFLLKVLYFSYIFANSFIIYHLVYIITMLLFN